MVNKIDWINLYKIKIANSDDIFQKHEITKLLVVMKILNKTKNKNWLRIYTEFSIENNKKPDVYVENIKEKSIVIYEIQKECDEKYIQETTKEYADYQVPFFDSVDLVIIPLKKLSNNIEKLNKQLGKYVI